MSLELHDVAYGLTEFRLEVSATLEARSTAIYGPSGAGKTTLLELIAGIRRVDAGRIVLDGETADDRAAGRFVPARARRIGFVPQDSALFPHLSVRRNILYGERPGHSRRVSLEQVVEVLEIGHALDRGVGRLSGGERKRVALARALMSDPSLLLLDEPLAGVGRELRTRILEYLRRIRDELAVPMLYVTHEREELASLCEEVLVLERGAVVSHEKV